MKMKRISQAWFTSERLVSIASRQHSSFVSQMLNSDSAKISKFWTVNITPHLLTYLLSYSTTVSHTTRLPGERDNARNNASGTQARKTTHGLDGQYQDVDRTPRG